MLPFSQDLCIALADPDVIRASGSIITEKFSEALGAYEDRIRGVNHNLLQKIPKSWTWKLHE